MAYFPLALLSVAAVLTLLYIPMVIAVQSATGPNGAGAGIGILFLAILRCGALLTGLLAAAAAGRLASIADSTSGQVAACFVAVLLVEVACNWILFAAIDAPGDGGYLAVLGLALSVALPGLLLAAGFCALLEGGSYVGPLFWGSLAAAAVCWMLVNGIASVRGMEQQEKLSAMRRQEEEENRRQADSELQRKKRLIEEAPVSDVAGLETLLTYTAIWQPAELYDLALARIRQSDHWVERLSGIMANGENRMEALGVLAGEAKSLPPEAVEHCWRTIDIFAAEFRRELEGGQTYVTVDALFRPALDLMNADPDARTRHRRELLAVQQVVKQADRMGKIFSLEAVMRLRDMDHPQGQWAEAAEPASR